MVQEILTAATRFRTGKQVAKDANAFRAQMKSLLVMSDQESRRLGYSGDDVRFALYAVVAYVDETVLNSGLPAFESWARNPLQLDVFGKHVAGEAFFAYLNQLLGRDDSEDLADLLEVYVLCLLLGFRGRYGADEQDHLETFTARTRDRITRSRGQATEFSAQWAPPATTVQPSRDLLLRRLTIIACGLAGVALVMFVAYWFVLDGRASDVRASAPQVTLETR
jgi:type VI secretion system protein ImpK